LDGIPPAQRGVPQIKVVYDIDANGILTVSASVGGGAGKSLKIQRDKGRLNEKDIERMVADAEKYKEEDAKRKECIEAKNKFENMLYSAKSSAPENAKSVLDEEFAWLERQGSDTKASVYAERTTAFEQKMRGFSTPKSEEETPRRPDIEEVD
jgi:L1 cell adhesion molecule like protein